MATEARYYVVTDLETTGLDPRKHEIIQISRVVVDVESPRIISSLTAKWYAWPKHWTVRSQEAMDINQISDETLRNEGMHIREALAAWSRDIPWDQAVVAAWGNDFEMKFLERAFKGNNRPVPFTYKSFDVRSAYGFYSRIKYPFDNQYLGLREAVEREGLQSSADSYHDAGYDARQTARLLIHMLQEGAERWNIEA